MHRGTPFVAVSALVLAACGPQNGADPAEDDQGEQDETQHSAPSVPGMVIYESTTDVAETTESLESALQEAGMVVATVDHAENADSVDAELRPTTLVIGGAPPAGTPLMQEEQRAGAELPQKFLAWQDEDGRSYVGYNSASFVAARAGIDEDSSSLETLREASAEIAGSASGAADPVTGESEAGTGMADAGYLVEQGSDASVGESIDRFTDAAAEADLVEVATVDHAEGAASIGESLRPTAVTLAGNPEVGTELITQAQTMGIDLPVRLLAHEDPDGDVAVGHPNIRMLAERHGLTAAETQDEVADAIEQVAEGAAMLSDAAAGES